MELPVWYLPVSDVENIIIKHGGWDMLLHELAFNGKKQSRHHGGTRRNYIERGNHQQLLEQKGKYYQLNTDSFKLD